MAGYDVMTQFPPGYRFFPTDEELVQHYLAKKVYFQPPFQSLAPLVEDIHAKEFYSKSPDTLVKNIYDEGEWYFFIHQDQYFRGNIGKIRMVGNEMGFWQCSGKEFPIYNSEGDVIGFKINLKYCNVSIKKNNWTMEKYRLTSECGTNDNEMEEWVLARLIRGKKNDHNNYV